MNTWIHECLQLCCVRRDPATGHLLNSNAFNSHPLSKRCAGTLLHALGTNDFAGHCKPQCEKERHKTDIHCCRALLYLLKIKTIYFLWVFCNQCFSYITRHLGWLTTWKGLGQGTRADNHSLVYKQQSENIIISPPLLIAVLKKKD